MTFFGGHIGGVGYNMGLDFPWFDSTNTIVGIYANAILDAYNAYPETSGLSGQHIMLNSMFSLSVMRFLKEIGLGPFVRPDAGLLNTKVNRGSGIDADSVILASLREDERNYGYSLLLGSGIAFRLPTFDDSAPIFHEWKVLLNVNYSFGRVEGQNYKILSLSIDSLFDMAEIWDE